MATYPTRPDLLVLKSQNPTTGKKFSLIFDDLGSQIFIPPSEFMYIGGTWTATRAAQGDVYMAKTAAANTTYLVASLRSLYKTTMQNNAMYNPTQVADRGAKIKSVDIVYSIGTLALTSQAATFNKVAYANNVANAVTAHGGSVTGTLATATQANPYVSTLTLGTQGFDMTSDADIRIEIAVVAQATSVYNFYGMFVNLDQNSL